MIVSGAQYADQQMTKKPMLCIAVVDDDDSVSEPIQILMEMNGWQANTYTSCEAFLDDLQPDSPPDCLVLDLQFPRMNGVELQRTLKRKGLQIPTIVLTAHPDGDLAASAVSEGALEIITKPVSSDELIKKIGIAVSTAPT